MKKISLCMITRNEVEILGTTLARIKDYMYEIIVVDTGSIDDTVKIAKQFTNLVFHFEWCDNFSTARNYANSLAKGDYVLNLDADELVMNLDFFEAMLLRQDECYGVKQINSVCEQRREYSYEHYTLHSKFINESGRIVLFRNHRGYHYDGIIHEYLVDQNGVKVVNVSDLKLSVLNITTPEKQKIKYRIYNELSVKQLEEGEYKENTANLCTNLLDYYCSKGQFDKFDEIFDAHSEHLLDHNNLKTYMKVIKKLVKKGHNQRAKHAVSLARSGVPLPTSPLTPCEVDAKHTIIIKNRIYTIKQWRKTLKKSIDSSNCAGKLICFVMEQSNFITADLFIKAVIDAFEIGVDFFEIHVNLDKHTERILNALSVYPVLCGIHLSIVKGSSPSINKVKAVSCKMEGGGLIISGIGWNGMILKKYLDVTTDFIYHFFEKPKWYQRFSGRRTMEDRSWLFNQLVVFSKENKVSLRFEGMPYCLYLSTYPELIGYSGDIPKLKEEITGDYTKRIHTGCKECMVYHVCIRLCSDALEWIPGEHFRPIKNFISLYKMIWENTFLTGGTNH